MTVDAVLTIQEKSAMPRSLAIGLAALVVLAGVAFGTYRAGWWPGTTSVASDDTYQQSRIDELRGDQSTVGTITTDMAAASDAGKEVLRQQGRDVTAQACTISSEVRQLPSDLTDFVQHNCSDGQIAAASEFAVSPSNGGAAPSTDPDPGAS
jgi:hypothetical protein